MAVFDAFTTVPPSHKPFLFVASSNLRNYTYVRRRQLSRSQEDRSTSNYRSHAHASHCRMASTLIICLYVCKHTTYVLCVFIFAVFTSCPLFRYFVVLSFVQFLFSFHNFHRTTRIVFRNQPPLFLNSYYSSRIFPIPGNSWELLKPLRTILHKSLLLQSGPTAVEAEGF